MGDHVIVLHMGRLHQRSRSCSPSSRSVVITHSELAMNGEGGREEMEDGVKKRSKRKQGGLRTMTFILGLIYFLMILAAATEACERFAASGSGSNMITYLTQELHMPLVEAANTISNFSGTAGLTPIIGALIADSFAGRFWTITVGSVVYQMGMIILTLSAVLPGLRPPACGTNEVCKKASPPQRWILYASLLFSAIGTGGLKPCVVAFGADQFDPHGNQTGKGSFFNLYFFSMGLALLLALTVVVYIQDNVGWGWGFGVPTIVMFFSVVFFIIGYPLYIKVKPGGSPLTRLTQVAVAAFKKRKVNMPGNPSLLYQDKQLDAGISTAGRLLHSNQLVFLDRAAIVSNGDILASGQPRLWRLSTVHRVEELKSLIRMAPIWASGILQVTATSHNHSFAIQQARTMNRHLSPGFQIPPASMAIFQAAALLLGLSFYDRIFIPLARRLTGRPSGITYLTRIGIGMSIAVVGTAAAALVEAKRRSVAVEHGLLDLPKAVVPISVFWLVPQYAVFGIAESFGHVGHMEFLYDQSPESMRSTAAALFWLATSIGQYMGTFLVTMVSKSTKKKGEWLQDNINKGKLDYYYCVVLCLQVLNLGYYLVCAKFYSFKPLEVVKPEGSTRVLDEEGGGSREVELARAGEDQNGGDGGPR